MPGRGNRQACHTWSGDGRKRAGLKWDRCFLKEGRKEGVGRGRTEGAEREEWANFPHLGKEARMKWARKDTKEEEANKELGHKRSNGQTNKRTNWRSGGSPAGLERQMP